MVPEVPSFVRRERKLGRELKHKQRPDRPERHDRRRTFAFRHAPADQSVRQHDHQHRRQERWKVEVLAQALSHALTSRWIVAQPAYPAVGPVYLVAGIAVIHRPERSSGALMPPAHVTTALRTLRAAEVAN